MLDDDSETSSCNHVATTIDTVQKLEQLSNALSALYCYCYFYCLGQIFGKLLGKQISETFTLKITAVFN